MWNIVEGPCEAWNGGLPTRMVIRSVEIIVGDQTITDLVCLLSNWVVIWTATIFIPRSSTLSKEEVKVLDPAFKGEVLALQQLFY